MTACPIIWRWISFHLFFRILGGTLNYEQDRFGKQHFREKRIGKKDVEAVLNGFLGEITEALAKGDKVQLIGFGTFETRKRAGRTGRNPQTGTTIEIPESTVPAFKAGNKLKEAVN